jgi:hypothetical protein
VLSSSEAARRAEEEPVDGDLLMALQAALVGIK